MRQRVVIAFSDVVQSKDGALVATYGEADGVRAAVIGKTLADAPCVAKIAAAFDIGGFRLPGVPGECPANAAPRSTEREHGGVRIACIEARRARMEIRARHSEVS